MHACEVAALVFPALISPMVSVDVKQHLQHPLHGRSGSRYHLCTLVTDYLAFVFTARAKIVAHVKDPTSTFDTRRPSGWWHANPQTEHNNS